MTVLQPTYLTQYNEDSLSTIMTVPELAEYLGIGRNRAYDMLRNNIIKGFRIGCTWKVSKAAVDEYIKKASKLV